MPTTRRSDAGLRDRPKLERFLGFSKRFIRNGVPAQQYALTDALTFERLPERSPLSIASRKREFHGSMVFRLRIGSGSRFRDWRNPPRIPTTTFAPPRPVVTCEHK
jgi:hypothetical protein